MYFLIQSCETPRRSFKKLCVMMERTRCPQDETVCAVNGAVQFEQLGWAWLGDIPQIIAYTGCILVWPIYLSSTIWQYKELCNHKRWLVIHYLSSWILSQKCHKTHILIKNVKFRNYNMLFGQHVSKLYPPVSKLEYRNILNNSGIQTCIKTYWHPAYVSNMELSMWNTVIIKLWSQNMMRSYWHWH